MIIGACGFSWSGSSAVADFLSEFEDIQVYDRIEFILSYHPDGLQDLDFHLNSSCSKFLSSNVAIPRFRWIANYLLDKPTKGKIKKITDDYLDSLIQVKWKGLAQGQILVHNKWLFENVGKKISYRFFRRLPESFCKKINLYPISNIEFSVLPDHFEEKTIEFTDNIFKAIGLDVSKHIVLDQPFAGNNPVPDLKYFRDSRAIIVDRDPRELYLLAKHYFPKTSYQVPHDDVKSFVDYYGCMHRTVEEAIKDSRVLYIRFEDLVFNYDMTSRKIIDFLGLKENLNARKCFVPENSMINTCLFLKNHLYDEDIKYIEENLKDYLFDFNNYIELYKDKICEGEMFDENPLKK